MKKNKILIVVPSPKSPGGVGYYYEIIRPYFTLNISYFIRGVRNQQSFFSRVVYPAVQIFDYMHFFLQLLFTNYSIIHINTSFGTTGIIRDAGFIIINQLLKKKYIVFFRGIDEVEVRKVEKNYFKLFGKTFLKANTIWVLSDKLKNLLRDWGYKGEIQLETTVVDSALLKNFDIDVIHRKYNQPQVFEVLFMSRIEKTKGIYETIDAFRLVHARYPNVRLRICGSGSETREVLKYIGKSINHEIFFEGYVTGSEKIRALNNAHIFLFPSYFEGMPNALLESIAFGLPAITSNVGGIPDIFINNKMGFITDNIQPSNLAELIIKLLLDPEICIEMGKHNYSYAREHFYAEEVTKRIESYYTKLIDD